MWTSKVGSSNICVVFVARATVSLTGQRWEEMDNGSSVFYLSAHVFKRNVFHEYLSLNELTVSWKLKIILCRRSVIGSDHNYAYTWLSLV